MTQSNTPIWDQMVKEHGDPIPWAASSTAAEPIGTGESATDPEPAIESPEDTAVTDTVVTDTAAIDDE